MDLDGRQALFVNYELFENKEQREEEQRQYSIQKPITD
jgi:hypothetical protein